MVKNQRNFLVLIAFTSLILASLACNLPGIEGLLPRVNEPIPISSEAADALKDNILSAAEAVKSGEPFSLVVTESQITSLINLELAKAQGVPVSDVKVYLRDGQATVQGRVEQNGMDFPLTVVLEISVDAESALHYEVVSAKIGPLPVPESILDQLVSQLDQSFVAQYLPAANQVIIQTITIDDGQMAVTGYTR
jgi:uncharacterized protein YpmS